MSIIFAEIGTEYPVNGLFSFFFWEARERVGSDQFPIFYWRKNGRALNSDSPGALLTEKKNFDRGKKPTTQPNLLLNFISIYSLV